MSVGALAFLNAGGTEIILILLIALALFGADRIPDAARAVARTQARFKQATAQISKELKTEEERAWEEQLAFERERERQMRAQNQEHAQHLSLVQAAQALGIATQGKSSAQLKAEIAACVAEPRKDAGDPPPAAP